jgi:hypothetical protein
VSGTPEIATEGGTDLMEAPALLCSCSGATNGYLSDRTRAPQGHSLFHSLSREKMWRTAAVRTRPPPGNKSHVTPSEGAVAGPTFLFDCKLFCCMGRRHVWRLGRALIYDRSNKQVSPLGQCFNKFRVVGPVTPRRSAICVISFCNRIHGSGCGDPLPNVLSRRSETARL